MRAYEMIFIVDPDVLDEDVDQMSEKFGGIIDGLGGRVVKVDKWGKRKLAYKVKKRMKGNYVLLVFHGDDKVTAELERVIKLDDRGIKYLTIKVDKPAEDKPAEDELAEDELAEEERVNEEKDIENEGIKDQEE